MSVSEAARRRSNTLYQNDRFKLRFFLPRNWMISEQTTHPSILVTARNQALNTEARLSVKLMEQNKTLLWFARSEVQVSQRIGFVVGKLTPATLDNQPAQMVEGRHPKKKRAFTQYFILRKRVVWDAKARKTVVSSVEGFVWTFSYPLGKKKLAAPAFEFILRSFKLLRQAVPDTRGRSSRS